MKHNLEYVKFFFIRETGNISNQFNSFVLFSFWLFGIGCLKSALFVMGIPGSPKLKSLH